MGKINTKQYGSGRKQPQVVANKWGSVDVYVRYISVQYACNT